LSKAFTLNALENLQEKRGCETRKNKPDYRFIPTLQVMSENLWPVVDIRNGCQDFGAQFITDWNVIIQYARDG
jgi:hypothetical protein